jgi:intracellular septation protein
MDRRVRPGDDNFVWARYRAIMEKKAQLNPFVKLALDFGPLILFFVVNGRAGIFWATGVFMAAVVVAILVSYALIKRFPIMTIVTAFVVVVFGTLTIVLQNDVFVKMKTTIIYLLFAIVLAAGVVLKKPFLEIAFDSVFHLTEEGWQKLTIRWIVFFIAMAIVNEIVWRTQTTDTWVAFKTFGFIPLTFVYALAQFPLMQKYAVEPDKAKG